MTIKSLDSSYLATLDIVKKKIETAQRKSAFLENSSLITLYWEIGKIILECQKEEYWGSKAIDFLAQDLKKQFPGIKGFSVRNLKYMRKFADNYQDSEFVQEVLAQIPWEHHIKELE